MVVLLSLLLPVAVLLLAIAPFAPRAAKPLALVAGVLAVFAICFVLATLPG